MNRLKELEEKIFFGEYSDERWKEIEKEVLAELKKAKEEEKCAFIKSGAGNLLAQIMEYMD